MRGLPPLIDGNDDLGPLLERAEREGIEITHVLVTHPHLDHVAGLVETVADLVTVVVDGLGQVLLRVVQIAADLGERLLVDHRAHEVPEVHRIAHAELLHDCDSAIADLGFTGFAVTDSLDMKGITDVAFVTMDFPSGILANVELSWLAPSKLRRTVIVGSEKMIVYDDLEPSEKIKVYDKGLTMRDNPESVYQRLAGYRSGDMWAPHLDVTEALRTEAVHFVRPCDPPTRPAARAQTASPENSESASSSTAWTVRGALRWICQPWKSVPT